MARIVRMEDKPPEVYAQLVAARLHVGVPLRVLATGPTAIVLEVYGGEVALAPVLAANLTVEPVLETPDFGGTRLSEIPLGGSARVHGISPACRGQERRRLLDLGVVPGAVVAAELSAPSGDPVAYRVRGALIALRRSQADLVHVEAQ